MSRKKPLDQKVLQVEVEFEKKKRDLKLRLKRKSELSYKREYDRKCRLLEKKKARKIQQVTEKHNGVIETTESKRKKRVSLYPTACKLIQLIAKLTYTNEKWYGQCICCPWPLYSRDRLDWWHFIPKSQSRWMALLHLNVHAQRKFCNSPLWWNGNQWLQIPQINEIHWEWTAESLMEMVKTIVKTPPLQFIKYNVHKAQKLLDQKKLTKRQTKNAQTTINKALRAIWEK